MATTEELKGHPCGRGEGVKYRVIHPGKWLPLTRTGFRCACCDCGLVHLLRVRISKVHGPQFAFISRDNRATGQLRRWGKYPMRAIRAGEGKA